jgi:VPDSG-CTERM motif
MLFIPTDYVNYVGDVTRSRGKVCRASDVNRAGQSPTRHFLMSGRFTAEIFADSALRLGLFWNPAWLGIGKARQLTARALLPLFRGGGRGLLFRPALHSRNGDKRASGRRPGDYHFDFSTALVIRAENDGQPMSGVGFGSGNGKFELSLDRLKSGGNPHVPDTGSTFAMLGMALCTLGGIARRVKA